MRATGVWSHPVPVPQFDAICPDGRDIDLDDLRGRALRIVAPADQAAPQALPDAHGVTTIILARKQSKATGPTACVAREPETWTAFAILSGLSDEALSGAQILADQNGWLRALWRPGLPGDWMDRQALASIVAGIVAYPIVVDSGGHGHHHGP
jgi:hypothetical protein